jgi:hypothetical protein
MTKTQLLKKKSFKAIEDHLKNYKNYEIGIQNMRMQLDHILPNITTNYELREEAMGAFVFSSSTEKIALDRIESRHATDLNETILLYELIVKSIDDAVNQLDVIEQDFVKLRYFKGWGIDSVAKEMTYSKRKIFDIRNSVREKLMISLKNITNITL